MTRTACPTAALLLLTLCRAQSPGPGIGERLAAGDVDGALQQFAALATTAAPGYADAAVALRDRALDPSRPSAERIRLAAALCRPPGPPATFLPEHDLALGKLLLTAEPAGAVILFERVLASPTAALHFDASLQLVGALQNCRRFAAMWRELDRCATLARAEQAPSVTLRRVGCLLQVGLPDHAERELGTVPDLPELAATVLRLRLDLLQWNERWSEVAAVADELDRLDPDRHRTGLIRATAHERLGDPAGLEQLRSLATATTTPESLRRRAVARVAAAALRRGDAAEAERLLTLAPLPREGDDELRIAHARAALAARRRGDGDPAVVRALAEQLAASWDLLLTAWQQTPLLAGGRGFLQLAPRRDLLAARIQCAEQLEPEQAPTLALRWWLGAEALGTTARELALPPPTIEQVQRHLVPPAGLLLVWLPAPGGGHVLAITADRIDLLPMPSDRDLRTRVRALRDRLRDDIRAAVPDDQWRDLAKAVAAIALPDAVVARIADHDRIAIAGREALGGLPFEVLPWPDPATPCLGAAKAVVHLPSLTVALHVASRGRPPADLDVALLAAGAVDAAQARRYGVPTSTLAAGELRALAPPMLAPERLDARTDATGDDLLQPTARALVQVVFAHGVFAAERATPAGLLLRSSGALPDGALFPDLLRASAPALAEFVLLGTCGAGRGFLRRGDDGGQTLSGALLRAGATCVAIADHDLELAETKALIAATLAALGGGQPPDMALRDARRERLRAGAHPAHALALRLEGPGHAPLPLHIRAVAPRSSWWLPAIGAAVLALALGIGMRARR